MKKQQLVQLELFAFFLKYLNKKRGKEMVYISFLVALIVLLYSTRNRHSLGIYLGFVIALTTLFFWIWGANVFLLAVPVLSMISKEAIEKIQDKKNTTH